MTKKTVFNRNWLDPLLHPEWCNWLAESHTDIYSGRCVVCKKTFKLSNMGPQAIISHASYPKHQENVKARAKQHSVSHYFESKSSDNSVKKVNSL